MFVMTISTSYKMKADMRVWRNRQTRTFKGRVRKSKGSSPFTRTNYRLSSLFFYVFFVNTLTYGDLNGQDKEKLPVASFPCPGVIA